LVEAGRSPNIEIITKAELVSVTGEAGDFTARVRLSPRYVDQGLCTACGVCAGYCPAPVRDDYNEGLCTVRALHIDYQQAIPAAFHIDPNACLFLTRKECKQCAMVCQAKAIDFKQGAGDLEINVGAVILAPGFGRVKQDILSKYGHGIHPDVLTGRQFERLTSASGPTTGHILRPSDGTPAKSVAFVQCVGARDLSRGFGYCSSVCCMYAVKEALVAKDHEPDLDIAIFYMDMRTQGKGFDAARERAEDAGVRFIRNRVGEIHANENGLEISYMDAGGSLQKESFDLVVLSEGLGPPEDAASLAKASDIGLNPYNFCRTAAFSPLETTRPGIFTAGAFQGPKDVPESVVDASGAAALAGALLHESRNTEVRVTAYPEEIEIGPEPRIGVFICSCGTNIRGVVDVSAVAEYAAGLDSVVFTDTNLYSCAQNTQEAITGEIKVNRLNRVVVAACTPRTHEPLFQETLKNAGLNPCLFEMANIRDQCSWVHAKDPEAATQKAKDLVRMAVAKARGLFPLPEQSLPVAPGALVVGGGVAGMIAALTIAGQGFSCFLVEKDEALGGNARRIEFTLSGDSPRQFVEHLERRVRSHPLIQARTNSEVQSVSGHVGNFKTLIHTPEGPVSLAHGAVVLATGGVGYEPKQYLHGQSSRVLTQAELEQRFGRRGEAEKLNNVVMIQCVGSRGDDLAYCSKVCCGQAVKNALRLLEMNPKAKVTVLYRDMRTYGFMEDDYTRARKKGVVFIPFDPDRPPRVEEVDGGLRVTVFYGLLQRELLMEPDLVALSVGIRPSPVEVLSRAFKVPLTPDGFFLEAHPKLRPVEFSVDGIFLCGAAHSPKPVSETIAQAEAAAGKACILLSKGAVPVQPTVSVVDTERCMGCGICEKLCPYAAIRMTKVGKKRKAETLAASCKGCGICASHCPAFCISMGGFTNEQILSQIKAFTES